MAGSKPVAGEQYFTSAPQSRHEEIAFTFEFEGRILSFETDAGVFSKEHVDPGSRILCENLPGDMGRSGLDMGCGWGAMTAMVLSVHPDMDMTMADINQRALELAKRNMERNGMQARAVLSDGFSAVTGRFDAIVCNPPIRAGKAVIYGMFEQARDHLTPGGSLYLVIRKQQGAESAAKYLKTLYPRVTLLAREKGYHVLQCTTEGEESQNEV